MRCNTAGAAAAAGMRVVDQTVAVNKMNIQG
jgi:hypothetical protein